MRIVGGYHRGRIINPPRNLRARPTTDFAKENLFNVLANLVDFETADVLDLFAGTGSISYEFASRGAHSVTAVELNSVHADFIRKQAETLKLTDFSIVKANVFRYLEHCPRTFDLIFADPPYDLPDGPRVIDLVFQNNLLNPDGILIFEHSKSHDFTRHPHFSQNRSYGSVQFTLFV